MTKPQLHIYIQSLPVNLGFGLIYWCSLSFSTIFQLYGNYA